MRGQAPRPGKEDVDSSSADASESKEHADEKEEEREQEAFDYSYDDELERTPEEDARFQKIKTGQSINATPSNTYEHSPYDLDRVNTKDSFTRTKSHPDSPPRSLKSKISGKSLKKEKSNRGLKGQRSTASVDKETRS